MANDFTAERWTKEDADGTYHSVTLTTETVAPEGFEFSGKRVTVSQSIMIGATVDGYSQYPDTVIVQPENSWATYHDAIQEFSDKIDGFQFASESFGSK
jgi:hypothetical protein